MPAQDPFEQVLKRLWSYVIEEHSPITDVVKAGSRVKRWTSEKPVKLNRQNADYPMLDVKPGTFTRSSRTSKSLIASQVYFIEVATGSQDVDRRLTLLQWELLRAFEAAEVKGDGRFNLGLDYVTSVEIELIDVSDNDAAAQLGRLQWTAIAGVEVNFAFDREKHLRDNLLDQ